MLSLLNTNTGVCVCLLTNVFMCVPKPQFDSQHRNVFNFSHSGFVGQRSGKVTVMLALCCRWNSSCPQGGDQK